MLVEYSISWIVISSSDSFQLMLEFYKTRLIGDRIWSIDGCANDLMYLVIGKQKAMLVDTGMGIGNLSEVIKEMTDLPLIVVNTHGHPDHAGGNPNFTEVWISPKDIYIMKKVCSYEYRADDIRAFNAQSPDLPHLLSNLIPFKNIVIHSIKHGDVFDLGDRRFEVLEIPGHTPGCIGLLNSSERIFFTGDSIVQTPVWLYLKHSLPFSEYVSSLQRIKDRENEFEILYPGHNPTPLGKEIFYQLFKCAEEIFKNRGIGELTRTFAGEGYLWKNEKASIIYNPNNWL